MQSNTTAASPEDPGRDPALPTITPGAAVLALVGGRGRFRGYAGRLGCRLVAALAAVAWAWPTEVPACPAKAAAAPSVTLRRTGRRATHRGRRWLATDAAGTARGRRPARAGSSVDWSSAVVFSSLIDLLPTARAARAGHRVDLRPTWRALLFLRFAPASLINPPPDRLLRSGPSSIPSAPGGANDSPGSLRKRRSLTSSSTARCARAGHRVESHA